MQASAASWTKGAEKIGYKIREAQLEKVPYMLVVGAQEEENHTVSVRARDTGENASMGIEDMIAAHKRISPPRAGANKSRKRLLA